MKMKKYFVGPNASDPNGKQWVENLVIRQLKRGTFDMMQVGVLEYMEEMFVLQWTWTGSGSQ